MAWSVVLIFFAIFCFVCMASILFIYSFFFESTVPMETKLQVGRGTGGIIESDLIEQIVRDDRVLESQSAIISATDFQSQVTVTFRIPDIDEERQHLVATMVLKGDTAVNLRRAAAPRFDWSVSNYHIVLRDFEGEMDVFVAGTGGRAFQMEISNQRGDSARILSSGHYSLIASHNSMRLINRDGEALMITSADESRRIPSGQKGDIFAERRDEIVLSNIRSNMVKNAFFDNLDGDNNVPVEWVCMNRNVEAPPDGVFFSETVDGRMIIRLNRGEGARSHGETVCRQEFPERGYDIVQYRYLQLSTSLLINYQSLSDCGIDGSECPVMLRIDYADIHGNEYNWIQGLYYAHDSQVDLPPRCSSCIQDHRRINEKVWYTFETGNLFNSLPNTPAFIKSVEIYASGHQYDVLVDELSLIVGFPDGSVVPPSLSQGIENGQ